MPLYEYVCLICRGEPRTRLQRHDAEPPRCCGQPMSRVITSPAGFRFRGSGFHSTDYGPDTECRREREERS